MIRRTLITVAYWTVPARWVRAIAASGNPTPDDLKTVEEFDAEFGGLPSWMPLGWCNLLRLARVAAKSGGDA